MTEENKRKFIRINQNEEIIYRKISFFNLNRRRFIRIREDDSVNYAVVPRYKSLHSLSKDLSAGGVRFICESFIQPHSILKVEIKLKNAPKVINVIVRTVWIKEIFDNERYEVGAEFLEINKEDFKFLNYYLDQPLC